MFLKKGYLLGNRYEIIEKIGAGGMSIVYKANCLHLKRTVAIKVLREEYVEDQEFVDKFINEATQVASLSHPNIVNIFDVGNDGDVYYIVMEYLDGKDLENIVHKVGSVDTNAALTILYNIGEALSYAHKNGIIHRDLKSKNIIINDDGIVKVADFGIATATTTSTIAVSINAIGSVHYFSPEQAKGEYVDERSDIYSLGIIGYELITGELPFDGDTPVAVALKHVTDDIPRPSDIKDVSRNVDFLIMKAASKDPLDRYQSVEEMLHDIDMILDGKDIVKDRMLDDGEIKKDEVLNFSRILEEYKDEKDEDDFLKEQAKKSEITRVNLEKFDDVNDKINDSIKGFNDIDETKSSKSKMDKFFAKLGIIKQQDDEDDYDYPLDKEKSFNTFFDDEDENKDEIKEEKKQYISLDAPINEDSKTKKVRDMEAESKAAIAAAKFFDKYDEETAKDEEVIPKKSNKKKFNFLDFITVEVEDDLSDEEFKKYKDENKKEKREQIRKEREESYLNDRKDDEMVDGFISKDDDRKLVKAAVITSLVIIAFILFGMIKYIMYLSDNRLMEVPDFTGEIFEEVKDEWAKKGFNLEVVDEETSQKYPQGAIVSQSHEKGTKASRHSTIEVVLSKGKFSAIMPDLQARSVEEAISALERYSVHITTSPVQSDDIQTGYIVSTEPSYGTQLQDGMNVVLYISQNDSTMYIMPNLVGLTLDEATAAMEEVGLRLGDASYEQGVDKEEAVVLTQNVPVGTSMFSGQKAKVTLGDKSKAPARDDKKDDDSSEDVNITKEVIKGTAYIRIENKSVTVDDATSYTVCIIADQPTLGRSTVFEKSMTGADIKKQLSQPVDVESDCDIHLTINGEVVKTLHYNK